MKLPRIGRRASAFCCECGERVTDETRPRFGGPRCAGCRALLRPRPGFLPALALAATSASAFVLGRSVAPAAPPPPAPVVARVAAAPPGAAPEPPPEPMHPCGARTKRGTPCKRLVRGPGHCYQHGGPAPAP